MQHELCRKAVSSRAEGITLSGKETADGSRLWRIPQEAGAEGATSGSQP